MAWYCVKRILMGVVTILIVATLTFFLMHIVPGGPFQAEKTPSEATLRALEQKYGLDKPVHVQFLNYMSNLFKGDFGPSMKKRGREVSDLIFSGFRVSAKLGGISIGVAMIIGIILGCVAAYNRGKWIDNVLLVLTTCGIAVPSFVVGTVLMYIFSVKLNLLPSLGLRSFQHYILPVATLSFYPSAYMARLMRSSMLDVLGTEYIQTARAKGLSQVGVIFKHALRNAILPVITYLGPLLAYTLTGSFVVETLFTINGLGRDFIMSIINRDYTMIMGTTIFLATLLITMNILVDIFYKITDPRIKLK